MAEFVPNPAGMEEFFQSPQMAEAMMFTAAALTARIRSLVPVEVPGGGHARASVRPVPDRAIRSLMGGIVAGVRVAAFTRLMHLIEFGTGERQTKDGAARGEMPAFAPFRRAAQATGAYRPSGRLDG